MDECIFCKIIKSQIPCDKVLETANYIAFHDIHPKAPIHILIVPKRHIEKPEELNANELTDMFRGSEEVAEILGVKETGYRLLFNVGLHAGQEVAHVHLHLLGGKASQAMY